MAQCDEGYLCRVCGHDVADLTDSDLYLQYVIGWIDPETLHTTRECHLRCNPVLAQFIEDPRFEPAVVVDGEFDKSKLDAEFSQERCRLVTRGYRRLWEILEAEEPPPVTEYPLPEALARWCG